MKGDFTGQHWQEDWTGENDRADDALHLGNGGGGSLSGDSNTKGIWEPVP